MTDPLLRFNDEFQSHKTNRIIAPGVYQCKIRKAQLSQNSRNNHWQVSIMLEILAGSFKGLVVRQNHDLDYKWTDGETGRIRRIGLMTFKSSIEALGHLDMLQTFSTPNVKKVLKAIVNTICEITLKEGKNANYPQIFINKSLGEPDDDMFEEEEDEITADFEEDEAEEEAEPEPEPAPQPVAKKKVTKKKAAKKAAAKAKPTPAPEPEEVDLDNVEFDDDDWDDDEF